MRAVWDPDKAKANLDKHGVRFSDAELVLYDPYAVTVEDSAAQGEQRHISIVQAWTLWDAFWWWFTPTAAKRSADLGPACDSKGKAAI
jgi:uncharacterized DUF497 family protein